MTSRKKKGGPSFIKLLHWVMLDPAYRAASHRARSLLLDIGLQYNGKNNGKLVVCDKALKPLGWNSRDGLTKAKRELLELGLLVETRRGARPNRAAWYALGWLPLDVKDGLDISPRSYVTLAARKIISRPPHGGLGPVEIRPCKGLRDAPSRPSYGLIEGTLPTPPRPSHGQYLDIAIPSAESEGTGNG
jgi:hypothetical protein